MSKSDEIGRFLQEWDGFEGIPDAESFLGAMKWISGLLLWAGVAGAMTPEEEIARKVPAALEILNAWQGEGEKAERKLHLVYWSPADREPAPAARERLTAILEDIRDFYAREMKRLGFGPRTIGLDYAEDGLL